MALEKQPLTEQEELMREYWRGTKQLQEKFAAEFDAEEWERGMQRQIEATKEWELETGVTPDPAEYERAGKLLRAYKLRSNRR